jgi:CRP-like cAMP-binding protein
MEALIQLLKAVYPLSSALESHLRLKIKPYRYKKGEQLVTEGEVASMILYLEKGLIRSYKIVAEEKASNYFMREGDIIISVVSFLKQVPALESIEALEDCVCWGISFDVLEATYKAFIEFNIHGRLITGEYYCRSEIRNWGKDNKKPEEIYDWLMTTDPELISRVQDSHMASYLEVSKATYYNIRRDYPQRSRSQAGGKG